VRTKKRSLAGLHRQEEQLLARSEASADAVERAILRVWTKLLAELKPGTPWLVVQRRVADVLRQLPTAIAALARELAGTVTESVAAAREAVRTSAPRPTLEDTSEGGPEFPDPPPHKRRPTLEDTAAVDQLGRFAFDAVLPGPTPEEIHRLVYSSGWQRRLAELTQLADPEALAAAVASSVARGDTPRQAAAAIRPLVQDVQASARRIARHETVRVAHEARFAAYEELGDFVEGYQIHAVLDSRTRPEHRRRDGTIYYRNPGPGQKGFDAMPRPPMEADGTVAFNCRCYLTPVLGG